MRNIRISAKAVILMLKFNCSCSLWVFKWFHFIVTSVNFALSLFVLLSLALCTTIVHICFISRGLWNILLLLFLLSLYFSYVLNLCIYHLCVNLFFFSVYAFSVCTNMYTRKLVTSV